VNYFFTNPVKGEKPPAQEDFSKDKLKTKAEVAAYVKKSFADGAAAIKAKGDAGLNSLVVDPYANQQVRVIDMAYGFMEHSGEHYGQLVVYYRVSDWCRRNHGRRNRGKGRKGSKEVRKSRPPMKWRARCASSVPAFRLRRHASHGVRETFGREGACGRLGRRPLQGRRSNRLGSGGPATPFSRGRSACAGSLVGGKQLWPEQTTARGCGGR